MLLSIHRAYFLPENLLLFESAIRQHRGVAVNTTLCMSLCFLCPSDALLDCTLPRLPLLPNCTLDDGKCSQFPLFVSWLHPRTPRYSTCCPEPEGTHRYLSRTCCFCPGLPSQ